MKARSPAEAGDFFLLTVETQRRVEYTCLIEQMGTNRIFKRMER